VGMVGYELERVPEESAVTGCVAWLAIPRKYTSTSDRE
jgi:hypothetical protein